jgi:DNA modification methylase
MIANDYKRENSQNSSSLTIAESPLCQVELLAVSRLVPYRGNARTHSRKQIRQIAQSIEKFGFTNPILIDDRDHVIAGHGRVEAAKLLDLSAVPTLRLSHLSPAEVRAYVLADNKLAQNAGWDRELLAVELQGLIDLDFDVELIGFEIGEIDIILEEAAEVKATAEPIEHDIPEPGPEPISRAGDLWLLGRHRIFCGDALAETAYGLLLKGEQAELVFADPPYNVRVDGFVGGKGDVHHREFAMASGEMSPEAFTNFLTSAFQRLADNSTDGSIHYVFMDWRHVAEMMAAGNASYTELKNLCVWAKTNHGMGNFYRSRHELVFVWKSGTAAHTNSFDQHGRLRTNVWEYAGISTMSADRTELLAMHPTVKPVALVADALKDCSRRNGIVLDPFLGSGTTVIAAERTGRRARGIEIDPVYVDVAVKRWQTYTGKAAILSGTKKTFEEIEAARAQSAASGSAADYSKSSLGQEAA